MLELFGWHFTFRDLVDIALVAVVVYFGLRLIRGTRGEQMMIGLAVVLALYEMARFFGLLTVEWMFSQFFSAFIIILVVLFQHEIRRGLVRMAVNPLAAATPPVEDMVEQLAESAAALVHRGWGGLIVLERETGLRHLYDAGLPLHAPLRPDVVQAIFCPEAPIHDGAIMVNHDEHGGRIIAARVLLPLAQANALPGVLGTRHRAAVGLTEESDALVVVVSEESGNIYLAEEGRLSTPLDSGELRRELLARLQTQPYAMGKA
jgi:diadenylate cyclase